MEVIVSCVLLSTVVVTVAPLMGWVGHQRRASEYRQLALLEVENIAERLSLLKWDDLTPETLDGWQLSSTAGRRLPDARLRITQVEQAGHPAEKRITIEVSWKNREGDVVAPVRLNVWRFVKEAADQ